MTALNAAAKAQLRAAGVSQAEWTRRHFGSDGRWRGDACGCPDDRCIGFHHDDPDDCGCLPALLELPETRLAELAEDTGEPSGREVIRHDIGGWISGPALDPSSLTARPEVDEADGGDRP